MPGRGTGGLNGDTVRTARIARHLTQQEAATQAGVSKNTWSDIERGADRTWRPSTIRAVLIWLDRNTDHNPATQALDDLDAAIEAVRVAAQRVRETL